MALKTRQGNGALWAGVCGIVLFASVYIHQDPFGCPTAISRLDLLHSLSNGRVAIDAYYDNTSDTAIYNGHYYSDKAPGTVALAWPAFLISKVVLELLGEKLDSDVGWVFSSWLACAGSIAIMAALGAGCLLLWLARSVKPSHALVTTLAIFLGAAPLPYATMMFSHALVVGMISVALWAISRQQDHSPTRTRSGARQWLGANRWDLVAGFACGWALASEYTVGIVIVGLFLWIVSCRRRRAVPFIAAAILPLTLVPLYSWACFGTPFVLPYSLNPSYPEMKEGLYAIKWPNAATACNLLFSPTRGLFFWTPFLFIAGAGYWKLVRTDLSLFWLTYGVPFLHIVVISGRTWDWPAGPTLGPRYLAPVLPLLALPCAIGVARFPRIGISLGAYSILITTLATLTNASPPSNYYNPLTELHIPLLLDGQLAHNLGMLLGLPSYASVILFYAVLIGGFAWLWRRMPQDSVSQHMTLCPRRVLPAV